MAFIKDINKPERLEYNDRLIYNRSSNSMLAEDAIFIDYANRIIRDYKINQSINKVYELIRDNLYSDQKLFDKYVWLRNYFIECLDNTINFAAEDSLDEEFKSELERYKKKFSRL